MSDDNDWFFETFKTTPSTRIPGQAAVIMAVLWAFIIAGVVSSIALSLNLGEFGL